MRDPERQRLVPARRHRDALVVALACGGPLVAAGLVLALGSGVLTDPGFATALAVTALLLLLG